MIYPHDPIGVMKHAGKYAGGKALIVLGGYSAREWERIRDTIKPDVILGANGVCNVIPDLDYWMVAENMTRTANQAKMGDKRATEFMRIFSETNTANVKLVSHRSWHLLPDTDDCISIQRKGYDVSEIPPSFTFREYGDGYLSGWILKKEGAGVAVRVGTVGLHLLHHAGILGCSEAHTIGFDLMFQNSERHHWYQYPAYVPDRFRNANMFVKYKGIMTQHFWIETAQYLRAIEWRFEKDGIQWRDHSGGLLALEGLKCAGGPV